MRKKIIFNDNWTFLRKEGEQEVKVTLPHTWNAVDGQDGGNDYYRGTCTYTKKFVTPQIIDGQQVFLEFQGVAMTSEVFVNGTKLMHHEGGYSTFCVNITEALKKDNSMNLLVVTADNGVNDRVYPQMADFTFYGGIYRDVTMIITEAEHFELEKDGTSGIKITPEVFLQEKKAVVKVESWQNHPGKVRYSILSTENKKDGTTGGTTICEVTVDSTENKSAAEVTIENVHLWNGKKDPYLYLLKAELFSDSGEVIDEVEQKFGCRKFSFDKEQGFFLNGVSYPLRGVSRHQDHAGVGNALTREMHEEDMKIICEIGANTVRLAHYQQAQCFYDLCDENGIVVWAEIPYISKHMPNGKENTLSQMKELITQNYNHPSIICWGLSNEITAASTVDEDLMENHRLLNDLCHSMDQTRPTTMAHVFMLETDSPLIEIPDIGSYNLYYGWYLGELEENEAFFDSYHKTYPNRIIGFSEYGADANPQYQTSQPERSDYTETYQCTYHEHILNCIEERPYLWATHVWNLFDFAADGRDEGGKHGVNQKGLVTIDRKLKKDAFYLYKAYWSNEAFVHICGRRYVDRTEEKTRIKVYSNLPEISLFMNHQLVETKQGKRIFEFEIALSGDAGTEYCIEAIGTATSGELETSVKETDENNALTDTITICKVSQKNPEYIMAVKEDVVNWFDKEEIDETCFSIRDKMGDIMQHPAGAAIVGKMMEQARASRGDVAKGTSENPALQKMLAQMTVEKILKQAGGALSPEQIKGLNSALQRIKKPSLQVEYTKEQPLTAGAAECLKEEKKNAVYPGKTWRDTNGMRIQTHGGAVLYEDGTYYWYGENKDRTDGKCPIWTWGIRAYRSNDLYNWEDLGLIIEPDLKNPKSGLYPEKHVDRPHILKCEATGKYVCWIKQSGEEACFLILTADQFTGPYTIVKEAYRPMDCKVGDFDITVDEAAKEAYLFMDADHTGIYGMKLADDYQSVTELVSRQYENMYAPFTREGVALFSRNHKKYMITSGMSGYIPNKSDAAISDGWENPFVSIGDPHVKDDSHASFNSQISQVFQVHGKKDLYVAIADRWVPQYPMDAERTDRMERFIGNHFDPEKYPVTEAEKKEVMASPMLESANTSIAEYVWLPLEFDGEQIQISWRDSWKIEDFQ